MTNSSNSLVDLKVVLLGKECVGKTALSQCFLHGTLLSDTVYRATIGGAFGSKVVTCGAEGDKRSLVLGLWDTAGSERYKSLAAIYYRGAKAAIICYDVTVSATFKEAAFWIQELIKFEEHCRIYLCGCKRDLAQADPSARQVKEVDAVELARSFGARVFETSSKTGENVDLLFRAVTDDYTLGVAATRSSVDLQPPQSFVLTSPALPEPGGRRCFRCVL